MNKLHPGVKWSFRFSGLVGLIPFVILVIYLFNIARVAIFAVSRANGDTSASFVSGFLWMIPVALIIGLIFIEIYARLAYSNWAYEFSDNNLKIERGIIWKRYSNVPYDRVQNVDIQRGIFARMLGFSTVDIQTAGAAYGGRGASKSEGHIPGVSVSDAENIRDFVMKKISKKSSGGL